MDFTSEESELNSLKKAVIFTLATVAVGFVFILMLYGGPVFPIKDISGCYSYTAKTYVDRVCLYPEGQYIQFYGEIGSGLQKYNSGSWRRFSYSNDLGEFVAGSLHQFIIRNNKGEMESRVDIDIQPHRDILGNVLFTRGMISPDDWREYRREE